MGPEINRSEAFQRAYATYLYEARAAVNRGAQDEADRWARLAAWSLVRSMAYFYSRKMEATRGS